MSLSLINGGIGYIFASNLKVDFVQSDKPIYLGDFTCS